MLKEVVFQGYEKGALGARNYLGIVLCERLNLKLNPTILLSVRCAGICHFWLILAHTYGSDPFRIDIE